MTGTWQSPVEILATLAAGVPCGLASGHIVRAYGDPAPPRALAWSVATVAAVFAWAIAAAGLRPILVPSLVLGWTLATLALVDLVSYRLPDPLTLPLAAGGLLVAAFLPGSPVLDHMIGAVVGWGLLAALGWLYRRLRGREGIGLGDAKLLGAAGAWLGWAPLPSVLLVACAAAFLWIALRVIVRGRDVLDQRLAFGGPLCAAIWVVWLHGQLTI
jgi:leader peptidase (prepilin peptidase)/N-methyltransferase